MRSKRPAVSENEHYSGNILWGSLGRRGAGVMDNYAREYAQAAACASPLRQWSSCVVTLPFSIADGHEKVGKRLYLKVSVSSI